MAKIRAKQIIKNSNEKLQKDLYIIKNDNMFIFNDDGTKTKLVIDDNKVNITRENIESYMKISFDLNNMKKCHYILKETNTILDFEVCTKEIVLNDKKIEIIYELYSSNEYIDKINYKLEWSD